MMVNNALRPGPDRNRTKAYSSVPAVPGATESAGQTKQDLRKAALVLAGSLLAAGLAGCAWPGSTGNPVTWKVTWFNYLDGGGLRDQCAQGGIADGDQIAWRLIYNADYLEQVRAYEIRGSLTAGGEMTVTVKGGQRPAMLSGTIDTLFDDWMHPTGAVSLSPKQMQALSAALDADGARQPAPDGLDLPSWGYYWLANGCEGGQPRFNAWKHPGPRFESLRFPAILFGLDNSNVPVEPAQPVSAGAALGMPDKTYPGIYDPRDFQSHSFTMTTSPDGLRGLPGW